MGIPENYVEKVYAGWLGKLIGIRHGAPIEMWTDEAIAKTYGEITGYLVDYKDFAADDDSNGPSFFIRALEDYTPDFTLEQMGLTWLNYVPFEKSFFWWGGYGISTEHTAYLNLRNGILPPQSGSVEQNGATVAEQIGGQIFIDTWGLVAPDNPELAAKYAQKAACVSHGGEGAYGGMFIAACISKAFCESDIQEVLISSLSVIPQKCEYSRVVRAVMEFHGDNNANWRECLEFLKREYWDDKYGGNCHIIPNAGIIVLSLLYAGGDYSRAVNICNMCGFDTDCNVANVGTIMGVMLGLDGIEYDKWRKPINDFIACSSVIGSLNIQDAANFSLYLAKLGYQIANQPLPAKYFSNSASFQFELPGSTHGFRVYSDVKGFESTLSNTTEQAADGIRSLKIVAKPLAAGEEVNVFQKTYYRPADFHNNRYDPSFSPILYPGQTLSAKVLIPDFSAEMLVCLYIKDSNSENCILSEKIEPARGKWQTLTLQIPAMRGACIEEAGVKFICKAKDLAVLTSYIDDVNFSGNPDYTIDFAAERIERWTRLREVVSQFTVLKGIWTIENGELSGSCCDFGEAYTGGYDWKDYALTATMIPKTGVHHRILFRVQGGVRSYALELGASGRVSLLKNQNGYKNLQYVNFEWVCERTYTFKIELRCSNIQIYYENRLLIEYTDEHEPYTRGQIGASVCEGSHCHYTDFVVEPMH